MTKEPKITSKPDIDLRLATIRRDCLDLAIKAVGGDDPIETAKRMFDFVTGKETEPETQIEKEWK